MSQKPSLLRSVLIGLGIFVALVIYAYGFQVTKVNLEETKSERRQTQLVRIIRAIFQPEVLTFDKEEFKISVSIMVPCPTNGYTPPAPDTTSAYMIVTPACAEPNTEITIEGFNFEPNTAGPVNLYPVPEVPLQISTVDTDANGHFLITAKLPKQRTSETPMEIRTTTRRNVGMPYFTKAANDTWEKIIETIFLALLATTFGTLIAAPLSFVAARNLMKDVTNPLSGLALAIIMIPIGIVLGGQIAGTIGSISQALITSAILNIAVLIIIPALAMVLARWALPQEELTIPSRKVKALRFVAILIASLLGIWTVYLLAQFMQTLGDALAPLLGSLGFLASFISSLGEIIEMLVVVITALATAGLFSSYASRLGQWMSETLRQSTNKIICIVLSTIAGAVLFAIIGSGINWLYELDDLTNAVIVPAIIGAVIGLGMAIRLHPTAPMPTGLIIYNITRTILNGLRSIESLVMVIVFVVWVGIGPFAGVLALALHTIAANAKLYSEQVESILPGPLEALKATGANRLQTIIYAVIPQIIPPFISLTMYRWDINVRMSTIIGFAGGGGIGFLLQQNMNLLNYRAASVQMLAIAIVVSLMDYLSSKMREKVV